MHIILYIYIYKSKAKGTTLNWIRVSNLKKESEGNAEALYANMQYVTVAPIHLMNFYFYFFKSKTV